MNGAAAGGTSGLYWVLLYTVPVVAAFYGLRMAWWLYAYLVLRRYGFNRARAWLGWACFACVVLGVMW